ncbi:Asp23/Gls24 family envelope stress response protein [Kribbella italica]|uniref:Putative alkaline shock family protein YloU n=1 Tax=Kribbella italica TaxID=1540520 RepID=A0A7W9J6A0_9ACTN|nr:Asp23/Gls24 family envelope stress response protein [Kribbella italica]MBB5835693.1 putative alkaline shock family protein YloU [Kribbella italica]
MEIDPPRNSQSTQETGHLLPCGRSVEDVWDDMEAGRVTDHSLHCPHCTTARAGLDELTEATRALIDDPAQPPAGFLDKIMTAVRADLSLGRTIPLPAPTAQIDISTHALAAVLRYAVDGVDGVRAHQCRIEVSPDAPQSVRVWMSVAVRFGSGQVSALDEARVRVAAALPERIGLELETLDFEVVDVWLDSDGQEELR